MPLPLIRDAAMADLAALELCYPGVDHAGRIRGADGLAVRYLVIESGGEVTGFGRLFLAAPLSGGAGLPPPRVSNLNVRPDLRGRGLGSALVREMERLARAAGHGVLHIGVSRENERALALYRRLGYDPLAEQPEGTGTRVYLVKRLA